ncbi:unnamed protein product, partial [marine sediment metagenome]
FVDAWSTKGTALALSGEYKEAIECFDIVLTHRRDDKKTLEKRNYCLQQMKRKNP